MRKLLAVFAVILLLCSCADTDSSKKESQTEKDETIKGVWLYYRELYDIFKKSDSQKTFESEIHKIFKNCQLWGLNSVFVQVRPFCDSIYPSDIFLWSEYVTGKQGEGVDYDPLKIISEAASEYNISLHAWINPFRISFETDINKLDKKHPVFRFEQIDSIYLSDNGIYLNPASFEAQQLVFDGIREILSKYDVDGIHIDDYFYPTTNEEIDRNQHKLYCDQGGELTLNEWRLEIINAFVSEMYILTKSINKDIIVSISPAGNIKNNYNSLFADVKLWCSDPGYCDMIIPQIYFGFSHSSLPFDICATQWSDLKQNPNIKLVAGIGAYKAVESENDEWKDPDIIKEQTDYLSQINSYDGYCFFSYSSLISLKNSVELSSYAVNQN